MILDALYLGGISTLAPEGRSTGMFKQPVARARIEALGLVGDHQADHRFHGGPEKAVHQFAPASYALMVARFPGLAGRAQAGALGENLSSRAMQDSNVCIGSIYRVGGATLQVSQPRSPCWKINHTLGSDELSRFIADEGICGWYYRVLEAGDVAVGDAIRLLDCPNPWLTLRHFHAVVNQPRPAIATLAKLIQAPGLNTVWCQRLQARLDHLLTHPTGLITDRVS